ncbi:acyltransferase family protein [Nocardia panacis]|uniref:acyltransferase family protein n=1 Tax=Nocardia panacis TaxID=2340916 RepID=UPI0013157DC1|nr:acyltransferase [Nocardia panacis]
MAAERSSTETAERRWSVDLLRVGSLAVVVVVHWISVRVTLVDGSVRGAAALHGKPIWMLTWLLQVMPLFFLAGGFANTLLVDRWRCAGTGFGAYLGPRARRLVAPAVLLVAVLGPVVRMLSGNIELARTAAHLIGSPLWFLAVYLVAVALAPLAVRIHDHAAWIAPVGLLGCSLLVDGVRFSGLSFVAGWNLLFVWVFCHQLGILHARGTFRAVSDGLLLILVALGVGILIAMVAGPYPGSMFGLADAPVSNLSPPTSAVSVLATLQFAVFTIIDRRIGEWRPVERMRLLISYLTTRLMTIYLWHVPVIAVLTAAALLAPDPLLPADPLTWWLTRPAWIILGGIILFGVVRLALGWDLFCARYLPRTSSAAALAGTLLAIGAIYFLWRDGLSPTLSPLLLLAGAALLTTTHRVPTPTPTRPHRIEH